MLRACAIAVSGGRVVQQKGQQAQAGQVRLRTKSWCSWERGSKEDSGRRWRCVDHIGARRPWKKGTVDFAPTWEITGGVMREQKAS